MKRIRSAYSFASGTRLCKRETRSLVMRALAHAPTMRSREKRRETLSSNAMNARWLIPSVQRAEFHRDTHYATVYALLITVITLTRVDHSVSTRVLRISVVDGARFIWHIVLWSHFSFDCLFGQLVATCATF